MKTYIDIIIIFLVSSILQISVEFTPPLTISKLSGEEYFCVFTNEEKNIEIKSIIDDDNYCNVTEVISKLDDISLSEFKTHIYENICSEVSCVIIVCSATIL